MKQKQKISTGLLLLIVINTTAMLISNVIACKVFSIGIGVLPCAVIVFPITYILSDVFSEVYGYKLSRMTAWISFAMNLFMVLCFQIAISIPSANGVDLSVLGSTPWQLGASLTAYMIGDLMNDKLFRRLKNKHKEKKFWLRALSSSLVGELCDSLIYIPLGMYILPKLILGFEFMTLEQILIAIPLQAIIKTSYELLILPVTTLLVKKIRKYEELTIE
jgi:uncharacterized integral membrane protein (TIGR00697 family)